VLGPEEDVVTKAKPATKRKAKKPELLPCPWCGKTPKMFKSLGTWVVGCQHICNVMPCVGEDHKSVAITSWNARKP
jgi:hypothetical protein